MPGVTSITWMAVSAPPGTPTEITQKDLRCDRQGLQAARHAGAHPASSRPIRSAARRSEMRKMIKESEDIWGPVVKAAHIYDRLSAHCGGQRLALSAA